jgi:hypothetical protein
MTKARPETAAEIAAAIQEFEAKRNRPMQVQRAEADCYIQRAVNDHPEYKFVLSCIESDDDVIVLMLEVLLRGALDDRLDFHEMLYYFHPDPAVRRNAQRKVSKMSQGKLPFLREQLT